MMMREWGNWDTQHVGINDENAVDGDIFDKRHKSSFLFNKLSLNSRYLVYLSGSCWSLTEHIPNNNIIHSLLKTSVSYSFCHLLCCQTIE